MRAGGGREVLAQLGCRWYQRLLAQEPDPIALASLPLDWKQYYAQKSEMGVRWHQTKVERSQAVVHVYSFFIKENEIQL